MSDIQEIFHLLSLLEVLALLYLLLGGCYAIYVNMGSTAEISHDSFTRYVVRELRSRAHTYLSVVSYLWFQLHGKDLLINSFAIA